jgi:hypothetical protein
MVSRQALEEKWFPEATSQGRTARSRRDVEKSQGRRIIS